MYFSSNIKFLRKRKGRTQDDVAFSLNMKRSTLSGYENQVAHPGIDALIAFSKYFKISVDTLLKVDLTNLPESQVSQIERGFDTFISGGDLRVLATTVDSENEENIELVSEKAKAGYTSGFADPEYIKVLPTFKMPFLDKEKKYRSFQISGDSMYPIPDESWVTAEFVQNWNLIKNKQAYIILTLDDGVVFKVVENKIKAEQKLTLHSLNTLYEPYDISIKDVREIWRFINFISSEMPESNQMKEKELIDTIKSLKTQVMAIQTKLNI